MRREPLIDPIGREPSFARLTERDRVRLVGGATGTGLPATGRPGRFRKSDFCKSDTRYLPPDRERFDENGGFALDRIECAMSRRCFGSSLGRDAFLAGRAPRDRDVARMARSYDVCPDTLWSLYPMRALRARLGRMRAPGRRREPRGADPGAVPVRGDVVRKGVVAAGGGA